MGSLSTPGEVTQVAVKEHHQTLLILNIFCSSGPLSIKKTLKIFYNQYPHPNIHQEKILIAMEDASNMAIKQATLGTSLGLPW